MNTVSPRSVLCAGDLFITPEALARAASAAFGASTRTIAYGSRWPTEPFGEMDGVHEASGDPTELAALASDCTVILTHLAPITAQVIAAAPTLHAIGVTRGGPVNVDLAAATSHGVPVIYLPGRNLGAVAEFVIGVMITLTRRIGNASRALSTGAWDARYFRYELTGLELRASTVGLVGFGAIGSRVAELLRTFGARVLAADPYADPEQARRLGVEIVELPELLAVSDFVSLHARLTPDTRSIIDAAALQTMRPGACLINTARGELVDTDALREAIVSGHLGGAALDVFDPEPPAPDDPLLSHPDVIVTPHLAGASRQVATESVDRVVSEVAHFIRHNTIEHCANPDWVQHSAATEHARHS